MVRCQVPKGDFFFLLRVFFTGPKLTLSYALFLLSAYRMTRGHKEVSTSQARRRRGILRETPTASNLVVSMFAEEMRLFSQFLIKSSLKTLDDTTSSTFGEVDNAVYFTREKFAAGLCLLVPSLVKQFLNFTQVPPTLVHLNYIRILMGYSVLNSLY